jgi:hypothetical protein
VTGTPTLRRLALAATAAATLLLPRLAEACAVCSAGREDSQSGFVVGSILLSVLPPSFVGCVALWVRHRVRKLAAEEAAGILRLPERTHAAAPRPGGPAWPASVPASFPPQG